MPWTVFQLSSVQRSTNGGMHGTDVFIRFEKFFLELRLPPDMALFIVSGDDSDTYYLSPATERHAPGLIEIFRRAYGAAPGACPPDSATLLIAKESVYPSLLT